LPPDRIVTACPDRDLAASRAASPTAPAGSTSALLRSSSSSTAWLISSSLTVTTSST
jgi:hypothetical protein